MKSEGIGVDCELPVENSSGSSDFGNVSSRCPAMHAWFDVTGDVNIGPHMQEFTTCTASDYAVDNMIKQIKALVMTGEDVLTQPEFLAEIKAEFERVVK